MKAVVLEVPAAEIEERRRRGLDVFDEVWEGVLHLVPPPTSLHQKFGTRLLLALDPVAASLGLQMVYETGVFDPRRGESDYGVPDLVEARPDRFSPRGVEGGASLVIEIAWDGGHVEI